MAVEINKVNKMKTLKDKQIPMSRTDINNKTIIDYYLKSEDVREAVLEFEKELYNISSDDFNHRCNPNYNEVVDLINIKFKELFRWEK